jgi:hypothetical protein
MTQYTRPALPAALKRELFAQSGNQCAFPGCKTVLLTTEGIFIGEVCHIEALVPGGPRYNPNRSDEELHSLNNFIVLCPNHHRHVDSYPFVYSGDTLREFWSDHVYNSVSNGAHCEVAKAAEIVTGTFPDALNFWKANRENSSEDHWQKFFSANPTVLAQCVPDRIVILGEKCYIGGKQVTNRGGNLSDYLFATDGGRNVVIFELKVPTTKLLGKHYRSNTYAVSEEITGAMVQGLGYRDELLKSYYTLVGHPDSTKFNAFDPHCVILAGDLTRENFDAAQMRSFELYRRATMHLQIITYDELFGKVQDLIDIFGNSPKIS